MEETHINGAKIEEIVLNEGRGKKKKHLWEESIIQSFSAIKFTWYKEKSQFSSSIIKWIRNLKKNERIQS